jgi:PTS system cellobiose-specific IIA component
MDELELICFKMISAVGAAKSLYMEAILEAKNNNFDKSASLIEEGSKIYVEGHHAHSELIQKLANGETIEFNILLLHAEDQMMSAETIKIMAEEFIELYKKLNLH